MCATCNLPMTSEPWYSNHWATWTEIMSEGYTYVQPVAFWWPVRYSKHWATWTKMMSEGYICVQPVTFWWPVRYSNYHWATWTEMMSEGYLCVQPVTFWWPVRCSNHWATWIEMMSEGYIRVQSVIIWLRHCLWTYQFSLRTFGYRCHEHTVVQVAFGFLKLLANTGTNCLTDYGIYFRK